MKGQLMSDQTITLAGRHWPIPTLAPRQNRIVIPALLEVIPKIICARSEASDGTGFSQLARYLDTQTYDRLTEIVFMALTRAHPALTRAEFDDMSIDTAELLAALNPIARAAGLYRD
jgi:hypothetical protein